jgi:predicted kinase
MCPRPPGLTEEEYRKRREGENYMGSLTILVGIPAAGKSSWAAKQPWSITVSSDAIRAELTNVSDQTRNGEVFEIFHERIKTALTAGLVQHVIADSTALDRRSRYDLHFLALATDSRTNLVYFSNIEESMARNRLRDRVVPEDVMIRMAAKYAQFTSDFASEVRNYDSITEVRT